MESKRLPNGAAPASPTRGRINVRLQREGAEVVITVEDDGAGLNVNAIRAKARQMGLLAGEQTITDEEALQLILEPGFSTADRLTQQAGRGVGMDVVATEVKKLGGGLFIESITGRGARFTIRLPFTLAITQALIVRVHEELLRAAGRDGRGRRAPAADRDPAAHRRGSGVVRIRRAVVPVPVSRRIRRQRAVATARSPMRRCR